MSSFAKMLKEKTFTINTNRSRLTPSGDGTRKKANTNCQKKGAKTMNAGQIETERLKAEGLAIDSAIEELKEMGYKHVNGIAVSSLEDWRTFWKKEARQEAIKYVFRKIDKKCDWKTDFGFVITDANWDKLKKELGV